MPLKSLEIGQGSRPCGTILYQKVEIFDILGPHSHPSAPIDVKFCTAKRTHVPVVTAKCHLNRCNESPVGGEKPDFWPVSKNNTTNKKKQKTNRKTNTTFSHLQPTRVVRSSPKFAW